MRISDWSSDVCSSDLGSFPSFYRSCEGRHEHLVVNNRLPPIQSLDQHRQLRGRESRCSPVLGSGPYELSALEAFCIKTKSCFVPDQGLQSIASFTAEQETGAKARIALEDIAPLRGHTHKSHAHVAPPHPQ